MTPAPHTNETEAPVVAILGLGQMALACAGMLTDAGVAADVRLWGHAEADADELIQTRRSSKLPGFVLPESVFVSHDPAAVLPEADLLVSAIPVQATHGAWSAVREAVPARAGVVSVAKGIESGTLRRPTQIIAEALADDPDAPARPLGCLSGPTIAAELARCLPATMVAAAEDDAFAAGVQRCFSTS